MDFLDFLGFLWVVYGFSVFFWFSMGVVWVVYGLLGFACLRALEKTKTYSPNAK